MTSFLLAVVIALAVAQAPGSMPSTREPAGPGPIALRTEALSESAVGAQPFRKLFTVSEDTTQKARLQAAAALEHAFDTQSRVVCGMTVIQADPRIDPRMIHRPAPSTFHIKRIPPTACTD
jgi:hypothetical protein